MIYLIAGLLLGTCIGFAMFALLFAFKQSELDDTLSDFELWAKENNHLVCQILIEKYRKEVLHDGGGKDI